MSAILTREFSIRSPFQLKRAPFLARFYNRAFHAGPGSGRLSGAVLRRLFRPYRALCRSPKPGEFSYARFGTNRTIRFDARNLQFQALYARPVQHGYEREVCGLLDALLPEGGTFFDIGSNWGFFSLYTASNHAQLTVHAFEPSLNTYRDLMACVEQAGLSGIVTAHNFALSFADGEAFIHVPDGLHSGQAEVTARQGPARITTRRLDSLKLPPPDFIKLDVEGHEREVLEGARETLQKSWPFIVMENRPDFDQPMKTLAPLLYLAGLGYRLYVPAVQCRHQDRTFFTPVGAQAIAAGSRLALLPFDPEKRLIYQHDLNVFACPAARHPQLIATFKPELRGGPMENQERVQ